jgi:hypothetical protein
MSKINCFHCKISDSSHKITFFNTPVDLTGHNTAQNSFVCRQCAAEMVKMSILEGKHWILCKEIFE